MHFSILFQQTRDEENRKSQDESPSCSEKVYKLNTDIQADKQVGSQAEGYFGGSVSRQAG